MMTAYQPSPPEIIATMLTLAKVGPGDVLYDLGCGDGRIVIEAVKRGATAIGIDIDPVRVTESLRSGANAFEGDFLTADFADASVVTMYLDQSDHISLLPRLLALKPGTRIVTVSNSFAGWKPTAQSGGVYVFTVAAPYCHAERNESCGICQRYYADAVFRVKIAEATRLLAEPRLKRPKRRKPTTNKNHSSTCKFLGDATGKTTECKTCSGKVTLKVFVCEIHGECTIGKRTPDIKGCCNGCKQRVIE